MSDKFAPMSIHGLGLPYVKGLSRRAWERSIGNVKFRDVDIKADICLVAYQSNANCLEVFAEFFYKDVDGKYKMMDENMLGKLVKGTEYEPFYCVVDGRPRISGLRCDHFSNGLGIDVFQLTRAYRFVFAYANEIAVAIKYGEKVKDADGAHRLVALLTNVSRFIAEMDAEHDSQVRSFEHSIAWYRKMLADMDTRRANLHRDVQDSHAKLRSYGIEIATEIA